MHRFSRVFFMRWATVLFVSPNFSNVAIRQSLKNCVIAFLRHFVVCIHIVNHVSLSTTTTAMITTSVVVVVVVCVRRILLENFLICIFRDTLRTLFAHILYITYYITCDMRLCLFAHASGSRSSSSSERLRVTTSRRDAGGICGHCHAPPSGHTLTTCVARVYTDDVFVVGVMVLQAAADRQSSIQRNMPRQIAQYNSKYLSPLRAGVPVPQIA